MCAVVAVNNGFIPRLVYFTTKVFCATVAFLELHAAVRHNKLFHNINKIVAI